MLFCTHSYTCPGFVVVIYSLNIFSFLLKICIFLFLTFRYFYCDTFKLSVPLSVSLSLRYYLLTWYINNLIKVFFIVVTVLLISSIYGSYNFPLLISSQSPPPTIHPLSPLPFSTEHVGVLLGIPPQQLWHIISLQG